MRTSIFRLALPFFDNDGGAGGGAPAGEATNPGGTGAPAPGAPATGTPAAAAPGSGAPADTPPAKSYTYKEDRSNWVPSHVVRQRSQELEKLRRDYETAQQRVAALSGVQMPKPAMNPEFEAVRNQLFQVAPELKDVFENLELLKELKGLNLKDSLGRINGFVEQSWAERGSGTLRSLNEKVKAAYGGAEIAPKQMARIGRAFIGELEDDADLRARYEAGDPSVIDEFVKDLTGGLLDPYRRSTAAAAQPNRDAARRLPRAGGGQPVAMPGRTVKPSDGDAFHKGAFDAFQRG